MPYEVLVKEYTAHRDVRELKNPQTGEVTGRQLGLGKVYLKGEVIGDDELGQVYKDILDDEDSQSHEYLSKRLKKVSGEASQDAAKRLGLPFADYDDMDEEAVVAAMRHLPSAVIQRIKQYESEHGEGREQIVHYNIAYGSDPDARQEGRVGGGEVEEEDRSVAPEDKPTAKLTTRNVPGVDDDEEDGAVTHGEGVTGTGEGKRPYGEEKADDEDKPKRNVRSRRSRRPASGSK